MAGTSLSDLFERTWRERSPMWKAYAQRLTGNPADAEDVVLEATTRTLETGPGVDSEGRLHAYVTTAIRHIAFEVVRKRRKETPFDGEAHLVRRRYASSALQLALSGEALKQRQSLAGALRGAMSGLPESHRQAVEWIVLRTPPLKLREVAERQGVTTSTVHYRLNRGLQTLADEVLGGVDFESLGLR